MNIKFMNTMQLNNSGQDNGFIQGSPFSDERLLTGNIPGGKASFSIKGDIPNPGLYLGELLAKKLYEHNYTIGKVETTYDLYYKQLYLNVKEYPDEKVFYTHFSFPMKDIIKDTNVRSNNHYAEHLIRTVGRAKNNDIYSSPLDAGIEKTKELWKSRGLNTDALMMYDGSGLSPADAVSPSFMCDLLVYMQTKSKNADIFMESLPKAGKNGTVASRLKGTRLAGKIAMKSGSINGVQCFSGYYIDGEKKYAFTIMVNKFTGSRSEIVQAIDSLLLSLF
jgi:D-alanyl-D-alanine carboxypeptidase/D-alanyl-D-alanine-endopeptidase (penicillin-binding protein 4)